MREKESNQSRFIGDKYKELYKFKDLVTAENVKYTDIRREYKNKILI